MNVLTPLFIGSGLLLAAISVPLMFRLVPPNPLYGFRVPRTLADESVWYKANAYSSHWLLSAGLLEVVAAVGLRFVPGLSLDQYAYGCAGVVLTALGIGVAMSFRHLATLGPQREPGDMDG